MKRFLSYMYFSQEQTVLHNVRWAVSSDPSEPLLKSPVLFLLQRSGRREVGNWTQAPQARTAKKKLQDKGAWKALLAHHVLHRVII